MGVGYALEAATRRVCGVVEEMEEAGEGVAGAGREE